jgi:hypothetical protein
LPLSCAQDIREILDEVGRLRCCRPCRSRGSLKVRSWFRIDEWSPPNNSLQPRCLRRVVEPIVHRAMTDQDAHHRPTWPPPLIGERSPRRMISYSWDHSSMHGPSARPESPRQSKKIRSADHRGGYPILRHMARPSGQRCVSVRSDRAASPLNSVVGTTRAMVPSWGGALFQVSALSTPVRALSG